VEGAKHIFEAGGTVIAESEETAVVYGMPRAAVRAGAVTRSLPLTRIASHLDELLR
jgi:two-component system chemotaxis response regulator CheB